MNAKERADFMLKGFYDYDKSPLNAISFTAEYVLKGNSLDFYVCFSEQTRLREIIADSDVNKEFVDLVRKDRRITIVKSKDELVAANNTKVIFVDTDNVNEKEAIINYVEKDEAKLQLVIINSKETLGIRRIHFNEFNGKYVSITAG